MEKMMYIGLGVGLGAGLWMLAANFNAIPNFASEKNDRDNETIYGK